MAPRYEPPVGNRGMTMKQAIAELERREKLVAAGFTAAQIASSQPRSASAAPSRQESFGDLARGVVRAGSQGALLDTADEIYGLWSGLSNEAKNAWAAARRTKLTGRTFGQAQAEGESRFRQDEKQFQQAHPELDTGARITGALAAATLPGTSAARAASLSGLVLARAGQGAVQGGFAGFAGGDRDFKPGDSNLDKLGHRVMGGVTGAATGAGAGGLGVPAGMAVHAASKAAPQIARAVGLPVINAAEWAFRMAPPRLPHSPQLIDATRARQRIR